MTTKATISDWYDQAIAAEATHMLVVCDQFDWSDYPVNVRVTDEEPELSFHNGVMVYKCADVQTAINDHASGAMQQLMECYDLKLDRDAQMSEPRAMHDA